MTGPHPRGPRVYWLDLGLLDMSDDEFEAWRAVTVARVRATREARSN